MALRAFLFPAFILVSIAAAAVQADTLPASDAQTAIHAAVASTHRKPENAARDAYRHPMETLTFFGVTPQQTVVEIWPDGGWYAEILAPMLRDGGKYIAAAEASGHGRAETIAFLASDPALFGKAELTTLAKGKASDIAPAGSADAVLTFRNVHNFMLAGDTAPAQFFADCYRALKPGGILGVVEHNLPEEADQALEGNSGYVKRSTVIALATAAGFKLDGESAINANAKDDHKHSKGVWTLPPTYSLGEADRDKYQAIGESDRMTLRFRKPL